MRLKAGADDPFQVLEERLGNSLLAIRKRLGGAGYAAISEQLSTAIKLTETATRLVTRNGLRPCCSTTTTQCTRINSRRNSIEWYSGALRRK